MKPMKFDGKQLRGANVDTVTAPKTSSKMAGPVIIVVILILAILGVVAYIFMSGILNPKTAEITFTKPEAWTNEVYAYVFDGDKKNADYPGQKMTNVSGNTYTYTVSEELKNGKVVFNDGEKTHRYPATDDEAPKVEDKKVYSVQTSSPASTASSSASK